MHTFDVLQYTKKSSNKIKMRTILLILSSVLTKQADHCSTIHLPHVQVPSWSCKKDRKLRSWSTSEPFFESNKNTNERN